MEPRDDGSRWERSFQPDAVERHADDERPGLLGGAGPGTEQRVAQPFELSELVRVEIEAEADGRLRDGRPMRTVDCQRELADRPRGRIDPDERATVSADEPDRAPGHADVVEMNVGQRHAPASTGVVQRHQVRVPALGLVVGVGRPGTPPRPDDTDGHAVDDRHPGRPRRGRRGRRPRYLRCRPAGPRRRGDGRSR